MIVDGAHTGKDLEERFDAVVIGSGAGGAVVAKELAEGGMRVAVLEEGAHHKTTSHTDLPYEAISRLYRDKGFTTTVGKPAIPVPMGRALGGTTVINSGTCFRTPTKVLEHWERDLGLHSLTEASFNPFFERVEREINVVDGEFKVMSRANTIIHEALSKRGTPGKALKRNIRGCEGCGFCCYGCPSGAKQSMDVSYLPKAFLAGAKAFTNTKFERFLTEGRRVVGVEATFHRDSGPSTGHRLTIKAPLVILAAGTIHSPQLLRNNGVAVENRNLGRNLTLHPATKVFARFDEEVNGWQGTPQAYYSDLLKDQGITFEGIFVPPDVAAMTVPFVGRRLNEFMRDYKHMAAFGFLISDSSTGRVVRLPFVGTTVLYNFQEADIEKFRTAIAFLARVFLEAGANKVYTLLHGYSELSSEADIQRLEKGRLKAEDIDGMAFHPLGTCGAGRVARWDQRAGEGVMIADGSVVPESLGVNPQVTIAAFGLRAAEKLLESRP
ncbi:MAG: GMC family oxidoreductase [Deltaproteobacteria bacterium]|nr:GMC family oxidoreductase [Deltaproteobacteria bacterium]